MTFWISASKRIVGALEPFDIRVHTWSSATLSTIEKNTLGSLKWAGENTGIAEFDEPHSVRTKRPVASDPDHHMVVRRWGPFKTEKAGIYKFSLNWDLKLKNLSDQALQRTTCVVEVRDNASFDQQISLFKAQFQKSSEWLAFMQKPETKAHYVSVWEVARKRPTTVMLDYHFGKVPPTYDPPWKSDFKHMEGLAKLSNLALPGGFPFNDPKIRNLHFALLFNANAKLGDGHVTVTGDAPGQELDLATKTVTMIFEPILGHEFGHFVGAAHHYEDPFTVNSQIFHLPPNESRCVMARNGSAYCSACCAAMGLDPVDNSKDFDAAALDLLNRYPKTYGKKAM